MSIYFTLITFHFAFWCHVTYAGVDYGMDADPLSNNPTLQSPSLAELKSGYREFRESRSPTDYDDDKSMEPLEDYESQADNPVSLEHHRVKRSEPAYFTPAYCKVLGYCGLMPNLSAICLAKCNFDRITLLKPYINLVPELPTYMCQTVNTIFSTLPKLVRQMGQRIANTKEYLKVLNIKSEDQADFAKTSANALPVTIIKNVVGPNVDEFKPVIKKLEIHDTDKKKPNQLLFAGKLLNSLLSLSTGQFVNPKCESTNLDDETMMMIAAMKVRKCNMDLLMPGYFVFNVAPRVASTREITPLMRAWNMPLLMFTGVKCCMTQFAIHNRRTKCVWQNDLLSKPHGLPLNNGPDTVCNSIPTFLPLPTTKSPTPKGTAGPDGETTDDGDTTEDVTTEPACNDANKSEMEECATEKPSVEYSEEATESRGDSTTDAVEEIESEETYQLT